MKPKKTAQIRFSRGGKEIEANVTTIDNGSQQFRERRAQMVLNRAMKGVHLGNPKANLKEIKIFCNRFKLLAFWIADIMPRDLSATVGAATFKAAIFYGVEKAGKFCETMSKGTFKGINDPAHLLWKSLNRNRGKENARLNYARTVSAVRAHCEGRILKSISVANSDIFEWGPGLSVPKELEENVKIALEALSKG